MRPVLTGNEESTIDIGEETNQLGWWRELVARVHAAGIGQIIQFLLVGGLNALIDIGSLDIILFIWPTTNDGLLILFNTFAYVLAILNSYIWNSRLTFRQYALQDVREKTYFFLQAGISLVLSNMIFLGTFHGLAMSHLPVWVIQNAAKALAMAVPSTASFVFMKYWVFRRAMRKV